MKNSNCQIKCFGSIAEPIRLTQRLCQFRKRLRRIIKRRWNYLMNMFGESKVQKEEISNSIETCSRNENLQPGDLVRIRSKEVIWSTLNRWNQLKGCSFMEEMWPYCGTTQRVFKRVEKFLDERDYLLKKCKGIVILKGVFCEGTKDFGPCDRSCFFFWREEWLEKI